MQPETSNFHTNIIRFGEIAGKVTRKIVEIETEAKDAGIEATIIPHAGFAAGFFTQFGQLLKRRYVIIYNYSNQVRSR